MAASLQAVAIAFGFVVTSTAEPSPSSLVAAAASLAATVASWVVTAASWAAVVASSWVVA